MTSNVPIAEATTSSCALAAAGRTGRRPTDVACSLQRPIAGRWSNGRAYRSSEYYLHLPRVARRGDERVTEKVSLLRQRKTAISSAVRGTSNRFCGIAAAMDGVLSHRGSESRCPGGATRWDRGETPAKLGAISRRGQVRAYSMLENLWQRPRAAWGADRRPNSIWNHWY